MIASEGLRGIELDAGSNSNLIENNYIGTDAYWAAWPWASATTGSMTTACRPSIIGNVDRLERQHRPL